MQPGVELLVTQSRPTGAKKLPGDAGEWRVRTGDYRVVYEVHDKVLVVLVVVAAAHRRDISPPLIARGLAHVRRPSR